MMGCGDRRTSDSKQPPTIVSSTRVVVVVPVFGSDSTHGGNYEKLVPFEFLRCGLSLTSRHVCQRSRQEFCEAPDIDIIPNSKKKFTS
jgi:hypothetical protein